LPGNLYDRLMEFTPNDLPDKLLMTLLATAIDPQTFNRLFEEVFSRYHRHVVRWCYKLSKNQDHAVDLTQEVFIKVFRSIRTFRGDSQLSTWLYVITRNHCLNSLKKRKSEPGDQAVDTPLTLIRANGEDAYLALERTQSNQQVFRFLRSILTPMEVRVMMLHYVHDLTLPAITRRLVLSNRSGAKAYIVSARRKLKFVIENYRHCRNKFGACVGYVANRRTAA
jgi:RNA polymerase sigma-70 factor (ECF subfamily)